MSTTVAEQRMSVTGLNREKCLQRNRVDALRYGVNTASLQLARQMPGYGQPGGPDYVRGTLPGSTEQALERINASLPDGATPLEAEDVYILYLEAANNNFIEDRFMFLGTSTLKNIQRDAEAGFAFMNSHRTGDISTPSELPFGKTFAGRYERYPSTVGGRTFERVVLGVYMLRGVYPNGANGPSTDDLYRAATGGTLFDVSMGINGGVPMCDVCDNQLRSENCGHAPGTAKNVSKEQKDKQSAKGVKSGLASYTLEDGHGGEVSGVYDGAVPGAGFAKAMSLAKHHKLNSSELRQMQSAYSTLLAKGDLGMYDAEEVLEQASDNIVAKLFRKLTGAGFATPTALSGEAVVALSEATATIQPPQSQQPDPEKDELRRQLAAVQAEKREAAASEFANAVMTGGKLLPAGKNAAYALMQQALLDDETHPGSVELYQADGSTLVMSRADLVKELFAGLPAHNLTSEVTIQQLPKGAAVLAPDLGGKVDLAEAGRKQAQAFVEENYAQAR